MKSGGSDKNSRVSKGLYYKSGGSYETLGFSNVKIGVSNVKCGGSNEKCGVFNEKCGGSNEKCGGSNEKCEEHEMALGFSDNSPILLISSSTQKLGGCIILLI